MIDLRQNKQIDLALDQDDFEDAQLLLIRQPTNLPYYGGSTAFQRINGEVEIAGVFYKYVKCRINNGMLEMLCLPNFAKTKLQQTKISFSKLMADLPTQNQNKKSGNDAKSFHKSISDFELLQQGNTFSMTATTSGYCNKTIVFTAACFIQTPEQPPDCI